MGPFLKFYVKAEVIGLEIDLSPGVICIALLSEPPAPVLSPPLHRDWHHHTNHHLKRTFYLSSEFFEKGRSRLDILDLFHEQLRSIQLRKISLSHSHQQISSSEEPKCDRLVQAQQQGGAG